MKKIITIIGTRPEIIKMSALLPLLDQEFDHILVHSGQHYSRNMDRLFFEELRLKQPDMCLRVSTELPGQQLAMIINKLEKILLRELPDAVIVQGNTNTTLAGALAVSRYKDKKIKLIHVEAGARSFNNHHVEEINRRLVDQISDLLLVANENEIEYVVREGIDLNKTRVTGNTVIESCLRMAKLVNAEEITKKYGLEKGRYIVFTFHRQETVDDKDGLKEICQAIMMISDAYSMIIPLHPRTQKMTQKYNVDLQGKNLIIVPPFGYRDMVGLLKNCRFCMTDSGGLQEEAAMLGIPTLILANETPHMKYVKAGINKLVSTKCQAIVKEAARLINDDNEYEKRKMARVKVNKNVSSKILREIHKFLGKGKG